jgi:hypothetical protein
MSTPWEALAQLLTDADTGANIYPTPAEEIVPEALVIRPDTPWMDTSGVAWSGEERYAVVALVTASTPSDGLKRLHELVHAIMHTARTASWEFDSVTAPVVDETTGTPFLAATVSLIYRNCEE